MIVDAVRPTGSNVLVRRTDLEETSSGIILSGLAARRNMVVRGVVVAVGPGKLLIDPDTGEARRRASSVTVGERVWFHLATAAARTCYLDEVEYGLVDEDNLYAAAPAGDETEMIGTGEAR